MIIIIIIFTYATMSTVKPVFELGIDIQTSCPDSSVRSQCTNIPLELCLKITASSDTCRYTWV